MVFKGEDGRRDKLGIGINIHILLYNKATRTYCIVQGTKLSIL